MGDGGSIIPFLVSGLVFVFLGLVLIPVLVGVINSADNTYTCDTAGFGVNCTDKTKCANETSVCVLLAATPILNTTYDLCTNASGVTVLNATPNTGCNISAYRIDATDTGLTAWQSLILKITIALAFVLAVFVAFKVRSD